MDDCPERSQYTGAPGPHVYGTISGYCALCNAPSPNQKELVDALDSLKAEMLKPVIAVLAWLTRHISTH